MRQKLKKNHQLFPDIILTEINNKCGATRELKRDLSIKSCFDLSCPETLWYVVMNCMLF